MATLTPDLPKVEAVIVEMTNAFRKEQGLSRVAPNPLLTAAARAFAEYLARAETFSHTADGRQPSERVKAAGYSYCLVAENLALNLDTRGFETRQLARDAVEGWKDSPGHRKNLMMPHVTEIGVAVARAPGQEKYLSVQLFGRPQNLMFSFTVRNETTETVHYAVGEDNHEIGSRVTATHSICTPAAVTFARAGSLLLGQRLEGRYVAESGIAYIARRDSAGKVTVSVVKPAQPPAKAPQSAPARR